MFLLLLKTEYEFDKEVFDQVFDKLDNVFDIRGVTSFTEDGEEVETIANLKQEKNEFVYEFDCENKITMEDGNMLVHELESLIEGDFELDGPVVD